MQSGATVVLLLAAAVSAGASVSTLWLTRPRSAWALTRLSLLRRWAPGSIAVALLASIVVLFLESAAMAEVPVADAVPAVLAMLRSTHYGMACCIGAAALALGVALNLFMPGRLQRFTATATMATLAVFWYTRGMVSHAASDGDFSLLLVADWAHLGLISLWVGEVFVAGCLILPAFVAELDDDRKDRARYVAALSTSATLALAGIFATGLFAIWHNVGSIRELIATPYGSTLLAKLALVGVAAALGAFNRFIVMPDWLARETAGLPPPPALPGRFQLVLQVEALVLLAALVIAVVLAGTSPPGAYMSP